MTPFDKPPLSCPPPRVAVATTAGGIVVEGSCVAHAPDELAHAEPLLLVGHPHGTAFLPSEPLDDLSVMGWLLAPWHRAADVGLRSMARWHGIALPTYEDTAPGQAIERGAVKAITSATRRLYGTLCRQLKHEGLWPLYVNIERPATHLLRRMEAAGVAVSGGATDLSQEAPETQRQWRGWPARRVGVDGRVHASWSNVGKVTGRISATSPTLQSLPKTLRHTVVAPRNRVLVVADYSGADFRAASAMSADPLLLEQLATGEDPYGIVGAGAGTAARGRHREVGKQLALAALYGARPSRLSEELGLSFDVVAAALVHYQNTYRQLWAWRDELLMRWKANGVLHNPWRRLLRPSTEAQAINYVVQSATADLMKTAMLRLASRLPAHAMIIAQIHDELLVECDEVDADEVRCIVETEMTRPVELLLVHLAVKVGVGQTWAEATQRQNQSLPTRNLGR